jgi:hypothetical protein
MSEVTQETRRKRAPKRDRITLALEAIARLGIDEIAEFAGILAEQRPRLAGLLLAELRETVEGPVE